MKSQSKLCHARICAKQDDHRVCFCPLYSLRLENEELSSKNENLQKIADARESQFRSDLEVSRKNSESLAKVTKAVEHRNALMFKDNKEFKERNEQLHREVVFCLNPENRSTQL